MNTIDMISVTKYNVHDESNEVSISMSRQDDVTLVTSKIDEVSNDSHLMMWHEWESDNDSSYMYHSCTHSLPPTRVCYICGGELGGDII